MTYVGEEAVDLGGPRREFWELMVRKALMNTVSVVIAESLLFQTLQHSRYV